MEDTNIFVDESKQPAHLLIYLTQLRELLKQVCSQFSGPVKAYRPERPLLTVHDGLLLKGSIHFHSHVQFCPRLNALLTLRDDKVQSTSERNSMVASIGTQIN